MPYKHNESRRHKFTRPKYKVTNWPEYNDALRRRGDIMIWFTEEAIKQWHPVKAGTSGRPLVYADHAIETASLIRQVFHLPLRQTEGFMNSIARMIGAAINIPDFSSISTGVSLDTFNGCGVGATLVDGDLFWQVVQIDGTFKKSAGSSHTCGPMPPVF